MSPARFSIKRPVLVAMAVLAVVVLGGIALSQLSVDLLPDMTFPVVAVVTSYPGAAPAQVEESVTKPIEEAAAVVEDLESIRSVSQQDLSVVIIEFDWGKDMNWAAFDAREKVDRIIERLPDDAGRPMIMKLDPSTMRPFMTLNVTGMEDMQALRDLADDTIKPELEKLPGVAAANIYGGLQREIQVIVNWDDLGARHISVAQVEGALRQENLNIPAGYTEEGQREYTVRVIGEFDIVDKIKDIVVATRDGQPIYLSDVATVKDTHEEVRSYARLNGKPAVGVSLQKESEANTVAVSDTVRDHLDELQKKLPEGVEVSIASEQAEFIRNSLENLYGVALEGAVLAMIIIFLFLATMRGTIIASLSIPLSLLVTFVFMFFGNLTINIITMGGLVLAIGRIVDDSVVVLENIYRHIEQGDPVLDAAISGTEELWLAIAAVTFTTMAVFFPLMFVGGMTSVLFAPMALVVMFGLLASLIVSVTIVPLLSERMLTADIDKEEKSNGGLFAPVNRFLAAWSSAFDRVAGGYRRAISWCLDHRAIVTGIALAIFVVSIAIVPLVGMEFFPEQRHDELTISMETPVGSSLDYTNERAKDVESILSGVPERMHYAVNLGQTEGGFGGQSSGTRTATFTLKVKPRDERERTIDQIEGELREKFADLPGVETRFQQQSGMGSGSDLEVTIRGDEIDMLAALGDEVKSRMSEISGLVDVQLDWESTSPEYHVVIDREEAGRLGLTVSDIGHAIQTKVRGTQQLTKFRGGDQEYDIDVRAREQDRSWVQDVRDTDLLTPSGEVVPLSAIATVAPAWGPTQVSRNERERSITISGNTEGRPLSEIVEEIDADLGQMNWPQGYRYEFGGGEEDRQETFGGMLAALGLGVLLIYMILASQFGSLVHPLVIMLAIPLEVIGVFAALLLTGTPLSVMVMLGLLMLTGIVVSNSILLVQMVNLNRSRGMGLRESIVEGGAVRLRPILMTAMATLLSMVPLALAMRTGSEMWRPLGIAAIGGLTTSTFLTLFVVPVAYSLSESTVGWVYRMLGREQKTATPEDESA